MNRLLRILSLILVLTSVSAFANSVNITNLQVNFSIGPTDGSGDNVGGLVYGSTVNVYVSGGTPGNWFSILPIAPGSIGGGSITIYFDYVSGNIGSLSLNGESVISAAWFNTGFFTFPTNGQNFTVKLPASLGAVSGAACGTSTCTPFTLQTLPGTLTLSFIYSNGYYYANLGTFTATTPEPATLGLMGIGISAIVWCWYKQNR